MRTRQNYGWLDRFRVVVALLAITNHTAALASVNAEADFFLTRVLARIVVPFFLMVTGQFVAADFLTLSRKNGPRLIKYIKKTSLFYIFCILLYLPIGIYAKHYQDLSIGSVLRMLIFDGTFYHLWYFPACIIGMLLIYLMSRKLNLRTMTVISAILYIVGLFGDSYYGLVQKVPVLDAIYGFGFRIFSYTRNGLFIAPLFLVLGMWMSVLEDDRNENPRHAPLPLYIIGLTLSFAVMTIEAFVLRHFQLQRHDSMYLALVPTMFFLYQCLLCLPKEPSKNCRTASTWIYILHPAFIVVVRAVAKVLKRTELLVDNSVVFYLAVTFLTVAAAFVMVYIQENLLPKLPLGKNAVPQSPSKNISGQKDSGSDLSKKRQAKPMTTSKRHQNDSIDIYDLREDVDSETFDGQGNLDFEMFDGQEDPKFEALDRQAHSEFEAFDGQEHSEFEAFDGQGHSEFTALDRQGSSEFEALNGQEHSEFEALDRQGNLAFETLQNPDVVISPRSETSGSVNSQKSNATGAVTSQKGNAAGAVIPQKSNITGAVTSPQNETLDTFGPQTANGIDPSRQTLAPHGKVSPTSRAWIELDTAALAHNVNFLRSLLPDNCRLMPAVKADAYGHGAVIISQLLNRLDVDAFCVACLSEGITLREAGITGEILILGYTDPIDLPMLAHYQLTQTVIDYPYAQALEQSGQTLHVHVAIDTGMHRLGLRCENIDEILAVYKMKHLVIDGLFTHLSASDSPHPQDITFTDSQVRAFYQVVTILEEQGYPCHGLHMLASYGILNLLRDSKQNTSHSQSPKQEPIPPSALATDYVRPGIALYGVLSTASDCDVWWNSLQPVLSLKAKIVSTRALYAGEAAGYGLAYTAKQDMRIATISIGYADGLPRELSHGKGSVLINGYRAPIIGRICMDQTIVDISNIPHVKEGDTAVIIGKSGIKENTAGQLADKCGTITNELLSRLGSRLERIILP